jgi:hypothetical protein
MRGTVAIVATTAAILAYLAMVLLISVAQTLPFMVGFVVCLFGITSAYVYATLGRTRPNRNIRVKNNLVLLFIIVCLSANQFMADICRLCNC